MPNPISEEPKMPTKCADFIEGFVQEAGLDNAGRPIVAIVAAKVPGLISDHAVFESLLEQILVVTERVSKQDYCIVYVHQPHHAHPEFGWFAKAYRILPYQCRKNLKRLYIVQPSFWTKALCTFLAPFISAKLWRKVVMLESHEEFGFFAPNCILDLHPVADSSHAGLHPKHPACTGRRHLDRDGQCQGGE